MAAQTFYVCQGGDGTNPTAGVAATAWDADDVSTSGNWASPKQANKIGPGDTIYFMSDGGSITSVAGTPDENGNPTLIRIYQSGTAAERIILEGDGSVILDGQSLMYCIKANGKDYITIENMELQNGLRSVISGYDVEYWIIQNCELHDCDFTATNNGTLLAGKVNHCLISHNYLHDTVQQHLIYFFSLDDGTPSTDNVIEYNIFENGDESGVALNGKSVLFTGNIIRYNWFYNNGWADIQPNSEDGLEIYGNIFVHDAINKFCGIDLGDDSAGDTAHVINTKIWNNTFYGYFYAMIHLAGYFTAGTPCILEMYNNVFYSLGNYGGAGTAGYYYRNDSADAVVTAVDNNIFYSSDEPAKWRVAAGTEYTTLAAWQAATTYDDNSLEADPLFTNAAGELFTLGALSPAKTAGTLGGFAAGLSSTVVKADFGRSGDIALMAFGTTPAMGAYAYGDPSAWVMIYG